MPCWERKDGLSLANAFAPARANPSILNSFFNYLIALQMCSPTLKSVRTPAFLRSASGDVPSPAPVSTELKSRQILIVLAKSIRISLPLPFADNPPRKGVWSLLPLEGALHKDEMTGRIRLPSAEHPIAYAKALHYLNSNDANTLLTRSPHTN